MLSLTYENPERESYTGLPEFREGIQALLNDFSAGETDLAIEEKPSPGREGEMGDPLTLLVLIKILGASAAALAAVVRLVKACRDLYIDFQGQRRSDKQRADLFYFSWGGQRLQLPASDREIEAFLSGCLDAPTSKDSEVRT